MIYGIHKDRLFENITEPFVKFFKQKDFVDTRCKKGFAKKMAVQGDKLTPVFRNNEFDYYLLGEDYDTEKILRLRRMELAEKIAIPLNWINLENCYTIQEKSMSNLEEKAKLREELTRDFKKLIKIQKSKNYEKRIKDSGYNALVKRLDKLALQIESLN